MTTTLQRERQLVGTVLQLDHIHGQPAIHRLVRRIDDPDTASRNLFHHRLHCCSPVDIDGIREPVAGSIVYGNNIITGAVVPSSNAIGFIQFGKPHQ